MNIFGVLDLRRNDIPNILSDLCYLCPCECCGVYQTRCTGIGVCSDVPICQPCLKNTGGTLNCSVFLGEISNILELKNELTRAGHSMGGVSDAEVFLCAYMEWAHDCVKKIRGHFSAAVLDAKSERIFVIRSSATAASVYYSRAEAFRFSTLKGALIQPVELDAGEFIYTSASSFYLGKISVTR